MSNRTPLRGWRVLFSDLDAATDKPVCMAASEEMARLVVRGLNARNPNPRQLYYCEWWDTSSMLSIGDDFAATLANRITSV